MEDRELLDTIPQVCFGDEVDRPMARDRTKRDLTERLEPPGQSRVVWNRDLYLYWLRFGYFTGGDSGSGTSPP